MPGPLRTRRHVTALALASLIPIAGCRHAQGAQQSSSQGGDSGAASGSAQGTDSAHPDPVARALDRVDAARARLQSADAAAVSAMRDLDLALEDVSHLEGAPRFRSRWPIGRFESDLPEHAERLGDIEGEGADWSAWSARQAHIMAARVGRRAAHEAAMNLRRIHRRFECRDRGDDTDEPDPADWSDSNDDGDTQ
jgi:hypothetical protein